MHEDDWGRKKATSSISFFFDLLLFMEQPTFAGCSLNTVLSQR